MPAGEVTDYIKLINDKKKRQDEYLKQMENQNSVPIEPEYSMAGNTLGL